MERLAVANDAKASELLKQGSHRAELEKQLQKSREALTEALATGDKLRQSAELSRVEHDEAIKSKVDEVDKLANQLKSAQTELDEQRVNLTGKTAEVASLTRLNKELRRAESQKTISLDMQQKRNEKLCRELAETCSKLADAELELEEKADTLLIQADNSELEAALDVNSRLERASEAKDKELRSLVDFNESLKSQLADSQRNIDVQETLKQQLQEQGKELRSLINLNESMKSTAECFKSQLADSQLDVEAQKAMVNELHAQYDLLQVQYDTTLEDHTRLAKLNEKSKQLVTNLERQNHELEKLVQLNENELMSQNSALDRELQVAMDVNSRLEGASKAKDKKLMNLTDINASLELTADLLKSQLNEELEEARVKIDRMNLEIVKLERQLDETRNMREQVQTDLATCLAQLEMEQERVNLAECSTEKLAQAQTVQLKELDELRKGLKEKDDEKIEMMMQINNNHSVELDVITSEFEREIKQKQAEMETLASEHVELRETYEKTKVEQAAELEEVQATHRLTLQSIELQFNQVKCELAKRNDDKAQEELGNEFLLG